MKLLKEINETRIRLNPAVTSVIYSGVMKAINLGRENPHVCLPPEPVQGDTVLVLVETVDDVNAFVDKVKDTLLEAVNNNIRIRIE